MFSETLDRFVEQSPASVMFRGTLENVVTPKLLDEIFAKTAKQQVCGKLLFSSVVDMLALVATGSRKSVNDAYQARKEQFTVSVISVYNKLKGVETEVSRQMVRQTALSMAEVVKELSPRHTPLLRGYRVKILDGNHLAASEHRIEELRKIGGGPLPGLALVVLEPDRMLVTDVFPCEDGHAQERKLLPQVLSTVETHDLWIADRNFCTTGFLFGIARRSGTFLIRQHKQTLQYELLGERRQRGHCPTGAIYEQKISLRDEETGQTREARRVTIKLKAPTRDGETEIHLLTNLPAKAASARSVAELYHQRWTVEKAFHELHQALHGEIKTLGYPKAALLSFCVALLTYNAVSVVKSAMVAARTATKRETVSGYYLAGELAAACHGMMIAVPEAEWTRHFAELTVRELAAILRKLAAKIRPDRFRKNVRGPKRPRPKRSSYRNHPHVSTARILAQRKPLKPDAKLA